MPDELIEQIELEFILIERLFTTYHDLITRTELGEEPGLIETTALASVVHSFYNGLEHIFLRIAKEIDQHVPDSDQWHRALLAQMNQATARRGAVLSQETTRQLVNHLGFRHFFRHGYSFFIEWAKLKQLVFSMRPLWAQVKAELQVFVDNLTQQESE